MLQRPLGPFEGKVRGVGRLRKWLRTLAGGWPAVERQWGRESFDFPGSRRLLHLLPRTPDIVHCHNLHGGYFDPRSLPSLSGKVPVVLTLHDAWLLSGHCAYSFGCERWKVGCGQCPDLSIPPAVKRDATAFNWRRKRDIYGRSHLYIATPSKWLMDKVDESMLKESLEDSRVIPYGVALSVFHSADRSAVRATLGMPQDAKLLLFTANGIRANIWKDYATLEAAIAKLSRRLSDQRILFIALASISTVLERANIFEDSRRVG